jgi:hypothetical protein
MSYVTLFYKFDFSRDVKLRHHYATRARIYGDSAIGPTERTKRLTVLINEDANGHKAYGLFTKNALFLFNLAGIEVNLIKVRRILIN